MNDVLETLREVDRHFQRLTGVDVPGQVLREERKDILGQPISVSRPIDGEHYDLWRRVRAAIKELENDRSGSVGRHPSDSGVTTAQPKDAVNNPVRA
jgi:hypothetical protein